MPGFQERLAGRLGLQQPLAVQIEPVMVGAPTRPFVILHPVVGIPDHRLAAVLLQPCDAPCVTVGVMDRQQQDDAAGQDFLNFFALRGGEVIGDRQH